MVVQTRQFILCGYFFLTFIMLSTLSYFSLHLYNFLHAYRLPTILKFSLNFYNFEHTYSFIHTFT